MEKIELSSDLSPSLIEKAAPIELFISDVDGVLTDGTLLYLNAESEPARRFHVHDGSGIKHWQSLGFHFAIITAKQSAIVTKRMQELCVQHVFQGQENKLNAYAILRDHFQLADHQIAYIGDDTLDIPILNVVGLAIAVQNAQPTVKQFAHLITRSKGGKGAVREAIELILSVKKNLNKLKLMM